MRWAQAEIRNGTPVPGSADKHIRKAANGCLDETYQVVCLVLAGQGGWPLTMVLTPDGQPFYAGTYFPPAPRYGRPGQPQVIEACAHAYRERRDEVRQQAPELASTVRRALDPWHTGAAEGAETDDRVGAGEGVPSGHRAEEAVPGGRAGAGEGVPGGRGG
ncbi:MAG: DUF255 domain-containing protein [Bacillota bacterium]|nr:DUF255 domain-containing protein [Bacillota bacterium]